MENLGRLLVIIGIVLLLLGTAVYLVVKAGLPLGRLPGDIRIERDGSVFYFPLATSLIVSLVLTLVLNIILRIFRK